MKCDIKRVGDGFQMLNFCFDFFRQCSQSFIGSFQFPVPVKIPLRVFSRGKGRVKGNGDFLSIIIVYSFKGFASFFQAVAVGVDQLALDLVLVLFLCVLHLLLLNT